MRLISELELSFVSGACGGEDDDDRIAESRCYDSFSDNDQGGGGDFCTGVPDRPFGYDFGPSCRQHDLDYSKGSSVSKDDADNSFLNSMLSKCNDDYDGALLCKLTAYTYYGGVRLVGGFFYEGP